MTPMHCNAGRRGAQHLAAVMLVLDLVCRAAPIHAQPPPSSPLTGARDAYDKRQYQAVVTALRPLLYPTSRLTTEDDEAEAYRLLGLSYWWLSQVERDPAEQVRLARVARREFRALLAIRPKAEISPLTNPPALVGFFEDVKRKMSTVASPKKALELELAACKKTLGRQGMDYERYRKECRSKIVETVKTTRRYFFWNLVPFGAGQFQNGHRVKGALFAASQGALFLINVTAAIISETGWIRNGGGGAIHPDQKSLTRARDVQLTVVTSASFFGALLLWSIIDGIVYYRKTQVTRTRRAIPIEVGQFELTPDLGPTGLGLGLGGRF
jgi:hypothetical protein